MPRALLGFQSANRAENLCYQLKQGQKLLSQFRKIVCLVGAPDGWIPTVTSFPRNDTGETPTPERKLIQSVLINGMCNFKDGTRAATAASLGAPSFRRTQAPFASTTTSCSCSPWFFVLLFPHDKNFAFIFNMKALVRLFLSCGSPCVRSTSDCAVLLRSWRTKRSDITSGRYLSIRVLSVVPRYAVTVGALKVTQRGNGDRENT